MTHFHFHSLLLGRLKKVANLLIFLPIIVIVALALAAMTDDAPGTPREEQEGSLASGQEGGLGTALLFFATVVYCLNGIPNLLPMENSLANPEHAFPVVFFSMALVFVACMSSSPPAAE